MAAVDSNVVQANSRPNMFVFVCLFVDLIASLPTCLPAYLPHHPVLYLPPSKPCHLTFCCACGCS